MNNIYFLESDNHILLDHVIDEILSENKLTRDKLITYDLMDNDIYHAIMDLDTYSLFNDTKVIYCKNATFLTTTKSEINHDIDAFTKYLNNPNPNNILIISCTSADNKKNIVKLLKEKAIIKEVNINLVDFIKKISTGYKISTSTINYLISNTGNDIDRITNELNKLMDLKASSKEIHDEDIDLIVIKKIDNNIFDLIDAIITKNKKEALRIYQSMTNYGEDIFKMFVYLSNQIRLIYQVKVLKNLKDDEIKDLLNIKNIKQVAAIRYKIDKYRENDLLNYLHQLSIMDEELKLGKSIDKVIFPIFIASL